MGLRDVSQQSAAECVSCLSKSLQQTCWNGLYPSNQQSNDITVSESETLLCVHFWIVVAHNLLIRFGYRFLTVAHRPVQLAHARKLKLVCSPAAQQQANQHRNWLSGATSIGEVLHAEWRHLCGKRAYHCT
jgi:hypothetical protein